jgi:phage terminase large subunit-like protein
VGGSGPTIAEDRPDERNPSHGSGGWERVGKTRAGAEAICDRIEADSLRYAGFVSRTPGDVRRVMLEGESGLFVCAERRGIELKHQPSLAQVKVADGGTITT